MTTPIKLFASIRKAEEVFRKDLSNQSEFERLKWFREAMRAELTLSKMMADDDEEIEHASTVEESYRQAESMLEYYQKALADADKEYGLMVERAEQARHARMRIWYFNMPESLKASELASWDEKTGWRMEVSY